MCRARRSPYWRVKRQSRSRHRRLLNRSRHLFVNRSPPVRPDVPDDTRWRLTGQFAGWNAHTPFVRIRGNHDREAGRFEHEDGNRADQRGMQLRGGRTYVHGLAETILDQCRESNALGLQISFMTEDLGQTGPARILSVFGRRAEAELLVVSGEGYAGAAPEHDRHRTEWNQSGK